MGALASHAVHDQMENKFCLCMRSAKNLQRMADRERQSDYYMEGIQIRKSEKEDIPEVMKIIRQAVESLKSRGVDQWQDGYPNEETIRMDIEKNISYAACIAEHGQERIVGTAAISFEPESTYVNIYDGGWQAEAPYVVIHRIATAEDKKGLGIAGCLMDHARRLCRMRGVEWMRIDTHRDNLVMRNFLKKQGFVQRGSITLKDGGHRFGYDMRVE